MLTGYRAGMMADRGGEAKRRAEVARIQREALNSLYASTLANWRNMATGNVAIAESDEPSVKIVRLTS